MVWKLWWERICFIGVYSRDKKWRVSMYCKVIEGWGIIEIKIKLYFSLVFVILFVIVVIVFFINGNL